MTTFLLKIDCRLDLGGATPLPKEASEWEGAQITFKRPVYLEGGASAEVADGDTILVWTHQSRRHGGGYGLTARGTARHVRSGDRKTRHATLTGVHLLRPHYGLQGWKRGVPTGSAVAERILESFHRNTYLLTEEQLLEFMAVVDKYADGGPRNPSLSRAEENLATVDNIEEVNKALETRYARQKVRPEQAQFRAALLLRYRSRCAISGCEVVETLQAAHVIPVSKNAALQNEPLNGLLLRCDIHSLFDSALLAIHPETHQVVLSRKLTSSDYQKFASCIVHPAPDQRYLRAQFDFFQNKQGENSL